MAALNRTLSFMLTMAMATLAPAQDREPSGIPLRGTFLAYRPSERIGQVGSHVLNKEALLFRVDSQGGRPIKLVYEHFGFGRFDQQTLESSSGVSIRVRRDRSCDETLRSFIANSPILRSDAPNGKPAESIVFLGEHARLDPKQRLDCYRISD